MTRSPSSLLWLLEKLRRFGPAREAVAVVEFALVLPIMLTMYIASIELSQAFNMDQRIITIAGAVGDLVSRSNASTSPITTSTLQDYFQAAQAIISPFPNAKLQQVVSVVAIDKTGKITTVEWSQGYNGGVAQVQCKPYAGSHPIPQAMLSISASNWVVVSEASYVYPPMLGLFFPNSFYLYHQNFYLPRNAAYIPFNGAAAPC